MDMKRLLIMGLLMGSVLMSCTFPVLSLSSDGTIYHTFTNLRGEKFSCEIDMERVKRTSDEVLIENLGLEYFSKHFDFSHTEFRSNEHITEDGTYTDNHVDVFYDIILGDYNLSGYEGCVVYVAICSEIREDYHVNVWSILEPKEIIINESEAKRIGNLSYVELELTRTFYEITNTSTLHYHRPYWVGERRTNEKGIVEVIKVDAFSGEVKRRDTSTMGANPSDITFFYLEIGILSLFILTILLWLIFKFKKQNERGKDKEFL